MGNGLRAAQGRGGVLLCAAVRVRVREGVIERAVAMGNGLRAAQGRGGVLLCAAVRARVREGVIERAVAMGNGLRAAQGRGGVPFCMMKCERLMVLDVLLHEKMCYFAVCAQYCKNKV
jgi:putative component of toxin-antitoxin plasmid stabilization module